MRDYPGPNLYLTAYHAATVDRLRLMIRRAFVWPDECDDIFMAARALGVHPADFLIDHPLADLYWTLRHTANHTANGDCVIDLSDEHCRLLNEAINRLEDGTSDGRAY